MIFKLSVYFNPKTVEFNDYMMKFIKILFEGDELLHLFESFIVIPVRTTRYHQISLDITRTVPCTDTTTSQIVNNYSV